jgi:hypothetical protein
MSSQQTDTSQSHSEGVGQQSGISDNGDLLRVENPEAVRLDAASYPDDAPLGTIDGKIFRFNKHRRHTAYDKFGKIDPNKEKNWMAEGADISDYFNYGMNEESWTEYAAQQRKRRNKLYYLMYLDANKISRPSAEEIQKMKEIAANNQAQAAAPAAPAAPAAAPAGANASADQQGRACYKCGKSGHIAKFCPEEGIDQRACFNCGQVGHLGSGK